jgi:hypothetical protein
MLRLENRHEILEDGDEREYRESLRVSNCLAWEVVNPLDPYGTWLHPPDKRKLKVPKTTKKKKKLFVIPQA